MDLKDEQWEVVKPLLPKPARRTDGRGRPRVKDREILNGILWIMRTGASWRDLPDRYPPYQTCHRRFQEWVRAGVFEQVLRALVKDVKERGKLDLTECFIDGTFVIAKKGAEGWERPSGARVQSSWQWQIALVFLSPYPLKVLRRMKSDWSKERSNAVLPKSAREG
jgi:transposase